MAFVGTQEGEHFRCSKQLIVKKYGILLDDPTSILDGVVKRNSTS